MIATILGGPRDGEVVDLIGPTLKVLVPRPVLVAQDSDPIRSLNDFIKVDEHRAVRDDDGRWWYVREHRS